jgi:hypothetical protein
MDALRAEELLASPRAGKLTATQLRAAVLAATGDERAAQRAFNTRAADMVEAGLTPE